MLRRTAALAGAALVLPFALLWAGAAVPAWAGSPAEPTASMSSLLAAPAGQLASGPRANGTAVLPDGRFLTPVGRSIQTQLEPQNGVLSHDGHRLYVSSEGVDDAPPDSTNHDATRHARFITIMDTATQAVTTIEDDALHSGLAESPDGLTLYVAEGQTDTVGVFRRTPAADGGTGTFSKAGAWALNPAKPQDYPWGLALSPDGRRAYVTGFSGDSLTTVDTATGKVLSRVGTGAYPYAIVVSHDGTRAYVSNTGLYNADAATGQSSPIAPPPATYGGYNSANSSSVWTYDLTGATPAVVATTRIGADLDGADVNGGSAPAGLALSPDDRTLAVTSAGDDLLVLLDTTRTAPTATVPSGAAPAAPAHPAREVDLRVLPGSPTLPSPSGAQPDTAAWTPDGTVLFVGEGERNSVAVVDPAKVLDDPEPVGPTRIAAGAGPGANRAAVVGRLPTAWYPSALAVSADSTHLFVVSMKGLGSGPNTTNLSPLVPTTDNAEPAANTYIPNTIHGRVTDIELSAACAALPALTATSDRDNGLVPAPPGTGGSGYVVPTAFGQRPSDQVKHVFLIIKENRSYDQIFGDQPGTERDGNYATYGKSVTPNAHSIADRYALSDNYYATTETSTQGHAAIDTGQVNHWADKVTPTAYANKFPYGAFDTVPENLPEGGFIWNNAARNGVRSTIFGEGTFLTGVAPTTAGRNPVTTPAGQLVPGIQQDGLTTYYAPYPSQVNPVGSAGPLKQPAEVVVPYNDEGRADAFQTAVDSGNVVSQLNVMILFDDHGNGDIAGAQTPEREIAENDHALGRVLTTISHSKYWDDSAVFVTEDDTQNGQDHVDAYRTLALVASPYARQGYVSHQHTSFSSMTKTIDLLLGLPPTSLQELVAPSMADSFVAGPAAAAGPYDTLANNTQPATNAPLASAPNSTLRAAARGALTLPRGIDRGGAALARNEWLTVRGEREAGSANLSTTQDVQEHTLPAGSPDAVVLGPPVDTHGRPAGDTCLRAATAGGPPPVVPETSRPALLAVLGGGLLLLVRAVRRRRRPLTA